MSRVQWASKWKEDVGSRIGLVVSRGKFHGAILCAQIRQDQALPLVQRTACGWQAPGQDFLQVR
jgi:hypothetical protein